LPESQPPRVCEVHYSWAEEEEKEEGEGEGGEKKEQKKKKEESLLSDSQLNTY
jgi:hypothetical protein